MAQLIQKIITQDLTLEIPVGLAPFSWSREYPTSIRIEGEVDPTLLREIIEYVERSGLWRWDEERKRFYPTE